MVAGSWKLISSVPLSFIKSPSEITPRMVVLVRCGATETDFRALDTLLIWLHRGSSWLDKLWSMQGDCRRSSHNVHRYCSRQQSDRLRRTLRTYAVLGSCGMRDQISDI
ncbi:uncharacterized protein LOC142563813 isoform X3 [Dermacentor variabilis]|uniref:uncharacterized protein LOC142563813 isoform X3 n=1 Tax=Dermacentor variabilis TaxID=34621 RepID=UPI003F5B9886